MTLDLPGHFYFVGGFSIYKFRFFNSHWAPCFVFLFELFLAIHVFQKFAHFTSAVGFAGVKIRTAFRSGFLCPLREAPDAKAHDARQRTRLPSCAWSGVPAVARGQPCGRSHLQPEGHDRPSLSGPVVAEPAARYHGLIHVCGTRG